MSSLLRFKLVFTKIEVQGAHKHTVTKKELPLLEIHIQLLFTLQLPFIFLFVNSVVVPTQIFSLIFH